MDVTDRLLSFALGQTVSTNSAGTSNPAIEGQSASEAGSPLFSLEQVLQLLSQAEQGVASSEASAPHATPDNGQLATAIAPQFPTKTQSEQSAVPNREALLSLLRQAVSRSSASADETSTFSQKSNAKPTSTSVIVSTKSNSDETALALDVQRLFRFRDSSPGSAAQPTQESLLTSLQRVLGDTSSSQTFLQQFSTFQSFTSYDVSTSATSIENSTDVAVPTAISTLQRTSPTQQRPTSPAELETQAQFLVPADTEGKLDRPTSGSGVDSKPETTPSAIPAAFASGLQFPLQVLTPSVSQTDRPIVPPTEVIPSLLVVAPISPDAGQAHRVEACTSCVTEVPCGLKLALQQGTIRPRTSSKANLPGSTDTPLNAPASPAAIVKTPEASLEQRSNESPTAIGQLPVPRLTLRQDLSNGEQPKAEQQASAPLTTVSLDNTQAPSPDTTHVGRINRPAEFADTVDTTPNSLAGSDPQELADKSSQSKPVQPETPRVRVNESPRNEVTARTSTEGNSLVPAIEDQSSRPVSPETFLEDEPDDDLSTTHDESSHNDQQPHGVPPAPYFAAHPRQPLVASAAAASRANLISTGQRLTNSPSGTDLDSSAVALDFPSPQSEETADSELRDVTPQEQAAPLNRSDERSVAPRETTPGDVPFAVPSSSMTDASQEQTASPSSLPGPLAGTWDSRRSDLSNQIANTLVANMHGPQEFVMQVHPAHLGAVRVELRMHGGKLRARLGVENDSAQQLFAVSLDGLKETLETQGMMLDSVDVYRTDQDASTGLGSGFGSSGSSSDSSNREQRQAPTEPVVLSESLEETTVKRDQTPPRLDDTQLNIRV